MRIWNSDGGEVESCGNATRCVVQLTGARTIDTDGGLLDGRGPRRRGRGQLGEPRFGWDEIPLAYADGHRRAADGLGRARAAVRGQCRQSAPRLLRRPMRAKCRSSELGPRIEHDPAFPERINVNVATYVRRPPEAADLRARRRRNARLRHRRLRKRGRGDRRPSARDRRCTVDMTGGSLTISWAPGEPIRMRGTRDPRVRRRARPGRAAMSVETITLGCRLNFAESETIARSAPAGRGLDRRQQLRGDQRSGAPDAPGDPPRASPPARRAESSSPAARPSSTRRPSRRCRRSRASSEMPTSSTPSRRMTS